MKWQIAAIGKPSLRYAKDGVEEYEKRLKRYAQVSIDHHAKEAGKEKNSKKLLEMTEGSVRLVLDERGEHWTTEDLFKHTKKWQMDGVKRVSFLIGGADGHTEALRKSGDHVIAMSGMTLQHELALVVLLEQLYRVHTILRGEPYHR